MSKGLRVFRKILLPKTDLSIRVHARICRYTNVQNMNLGARERLGPVRMICLAITTSFKLHVVKGSFDTKISGREDPPQATP